MRHSRLIKQIHNCRVIAILGLLLQLVVAQTDGSNPSAAPRASIAGVMVDAVTGQPLNHVQVTLQSLVNLNDKKNTLTDANGHFSIGELPEGQYLVSLRYRNYSEDPDSVHQIQLKAGEVLQGVTWKLFPPAALSGRVLDEAGAPMEGIVVQAQSQVLAGYAVTDENGQFRVGGLRPGSYRLLAVPQESRLPQEIRTDGTTETNYAPTYYPSALDRKGASRISVAAGEQVGDLEIQFRAFPILKLSGWISGVPKDGECAGLTLNHDQAGFGVPLGPDRRFTIWRLAPGSYTLSAQCHDLAGHALVSGVVPFEVSNTNIDNLDVRVASLFGVAGKVEPDDFGQTTRPLFVNTFVRLCDQQGCGGPLAPIGRNGAFQLLNVSLGSYRVALVGFPQNAYVKSVQIGLTDSMDGSIDLRNGPPRDPITVFVSKAEGRISGTVFGPKTLIPRAVAVLIDQRFAFLFPRTATVGSDGTYVFEGVPPGRYTLIAIDQAQVPSTWQDDALTRYKGVIEELDLTGNNVINRDINLFVINHTPAPNR